MPHILCLLLFFFFITLPAQSDNSTYPHCRPDNCGDVNISYPFWKMNSESTTLFCGYEGFGINCSSIGQQNISDIKLGGELYHVWAISNELQTIFLSDYDVSTVANVPNNCPRVRHNITLGTLPLNFVTYSVNLSFHFNCSEIPSFAAEIPCLETNERRSCVHVISSSNEDTDWEEFSCDQEVVTTVSSEFVNMFPDLSTQFSSILEKGFGLRWGRMEACKKCEESGGLCGRHNSTGFVCFCSNGSISRGRCEGTFKTFPKFQFYPFLATFDF